MLRLLTDSGGTLYLMVSTTAPILHRRYNQTEWTLYVQDEWFIDRIDALHHMRELPVHPSHEDIYNEIVLFGKDQ